MRLQNLLRLTALIYLIASIAPGLRAQEGEAAPPSPEPQQLVTIRALRANIKTMEAQRDGKQNELLAATTVADKEELAADLRDLSAKIASLRDDLESVATGVDVRLFDKKLGEDVQFDAEFRELVQPIIQEMKRATAKPRELEQLRNAIPYHKNRLELAEKALVQLRDLISKTEDEDMMKELVTMEKTWVANREEYKNELLTAQYQFNERMRTEESLWDTLKGGVASFFKTRGKNILIAISITIFALFSLRLLHRAIRRLSPFRKRGNTFGARLFDVSYYLFTILIATTAGLSAFYALGDWMLLGFSLILLAGFAWASKTALPGVYEQIKLILNLGSVREGERIVIDGVPWQVRRISIFTSLVNPSLEGGQLRLPVRDLIPLSSRPWTTKEPFFPCEKGNWLLLGDGTLGKVIRQTPEWVQLVLLGSTIKTYTTSEFLGQNPKNISLGFRVLETFGIDYAHQESSTTKIPALLKERLESGLTQVAGEANVVNVRVEFASAGASSLDYAVLADFAGGAAEKYNQLGRAVQRICVDACNEFGWVIPFTQVTLHNAASPSPAPNPTSD